MRYAILKPEYALGLPREYRVVARLELAVLVTFPDELEPPAASVEIDPATARLLINHPDN